jgi:Flp pilus assembly pilin Flp
MSNWLPKKKSGQTMTEYIIIVAIVAIAAIAIFGYFSDVIQTKVSGAGAAMDNDNVTRPQVQAGDSVNALKNLDATGQLSGGS